MAFEEGTHELTCKHCGAVHIARFSRMPVREWEKHKCLNCAGWLINGNSKFDHYNIKLKDLT